MSDGETKLIMGVPHVFARQHLQKPFYTEIIALIQRPVICRNGCGLFYIPMPEHMKHVDPSQRSIACPDCKVDPLPHNIGSEEEIEVAVRMAFGNVQTIHFHRALGRAAERVKVEQRSIALPASIALVKAPPKPE